MRYLLFWILLLPIISFGQSSQTTTVLNIGGAGYITIDHEQYPRGQVYSFYSTTRTGDTTLQITGLGVMAGGKKWDKYLDGDNSNTPFASGLDLLNWMNSNFEAKPDTIVTGGGGGGSGTVTSVSFANANGLKAIVSNSTTAAVITASTTVTSGSMIKSSSGAFSAATSNTDYLPPLNPIITGTLTVNGISTFTDVATFQNGISMSNKKITNLLTPSSPTDAATKGYADNFLSKSLTTSHIFAGNVSNTAEDNSIDGTSEIQLSSSSGVLTFSVIPQDITSNNTSTSAHGFAPKLDGNTSHFLNGGGAWSTPSGGAGSAGGTVTGVSIATANGFKGSSDGDAVNPTLTYSTTVTSGSILKSSTGAIVAATLNADYTSTVTRLDQFSSPNTNLSVAGFKLTNVATPTLSNDGANKSYVDNIAAGINPAVAVAAASISNISGYTYNNGASGVGATLTQNSAAVVVIDGYTLLLNDRVLFKNQTTSANNGVYVITTLGTGVIPAVFTRASDYNQPSDINSTGTIPVVNGTVNALTSWLLTSTVNIVGTDALTYSQFSYNPSVLITTSTSAGGDLTGTYPNPTLAINRMNALNPTALKTSAYTALPNDLVTVNTTSGGVTITLTATPTDKSLIAIKHIIQGGTNFVTVTCGGSDVFNKASGTTSFTMPYVNQSYLFQYQASTGIWYIIADDLPKSALDAVYTSTVIGTPNIAVTGSPSAGFTVTLVASPALQGSPTAATQSLGDNSTKLATTAYVDLTKVAYSTTSNPTFTGTVTVNGVSVFSTTSTFKGNVQINGVETFSNNPVYSWASTDNGILYTSGSTVLQTTSITPSKLQVQTWQWIDVDSAQNLNIAVGAPTYTVTGFSTYTVTASRWSRVGSLVTMCINVSGTSNATTFTVSIPKTSWASDDQYFWARVTDNGTVIQATLPMAKITANTNVINIYKSVVSGAFTNTGTKAVTMSFSYYASP